MKRRKARLVTNEGSVSEQFCTHLASADGKMRVEMLDGKQYLVGPVVMIKEGVWNKLLYTSNELSKFAEAWNGRPITVKHPEKGGRRVSANQPDLKAVDVGIVYNARYDAPRLKGELWIEQDKLKKVHPSLANRVAAGKPVEVSTGLFLEAAMQNGEWQGTPYEGVTKNYRPDHLALLPDEKGACSWEAGAGFPRTNSSVTQTEEEAPMKERKEQIAELIANKLATKKEVTVLEALDDDAFELVVNARQETAEAKAETIKAGEKKQVDEAKAKKEADEKFAANVEAEVKKRLAENAENAGDDRKVTDDELKALIESNIAKQVAEQVTKIVPMLVKNAGEEAAKRELVDEIVSTKALKISEKSLMAMETNELREMLRAINPALAMRYGFQPNDADGDDEGSKVPEPPKVDWTGALKTMDAQSK